MGRRPSAVITLVERTSRRVVLVALPEGIKAPAVRAALVSAFGQLPQSMVKSLTWDRGREMADHRAFTEWTGGPVFFCAARSPWQRGSNENTVSIEDGWMADQSGWCRQPEVTLENTDRLLGVSFV